jgi:hypothetical protein
MAKHRCNYTIFVSERRGDTRGETIETWACECGDTTEIKGTVY